MNEAKCGEKRDMQKEKQGGRETPKEEERRSTTLPLSPPRISRRLFSPHPYLLTFLLPSPFFTLLQPIYIPTSSQNHLFQKKVNSLQPERMIFLGIISCKCILKSTLFGLFCLRFMTVFNIL